MFINLGNYMRNQISFKVWGDYALFTDPVTKIGGEKLSYLVPTYEAIKGVLKSIYWKPTIIWYVDKVRIIKPFKTQTKGLKPLRWDKGGNDLSIYTYLQHVEYQVQAHFEWNPYREELKADQIDGKHFSIINRVLEKGGRQDIFLGTRDCQGYVEPCVFGEGVGTYDETPELSFGQVFHSFDYPDEIGIDEFHANFWQAKMEKGVLNFPKPKDCKVKRFIRKMTPKQFSLGQNQLAVELQEQQL